MVIDINKIHLKDSERTKCEVWTRTMGYYRPVSFFNPGKKQEYLDRKNYKIKEDDKEKIK